MQKEPDTIQQAPLLSNCEQQQGDKCCGLLWPDAFTKSGVNSTTAGHLIKEVVSSLRIIISATSYSQHQLMWRKVSTRFHFSNIMEAYRSGSPGVVVWGGIILNKWTQLYVFDRVSVNRDRSYKEVILPHVRLF
ncbi:transposable element Tcb2 transposase [Trichonephila clavipes]|nr:transposable element Tcb2 transposase [Trichonephila clavipes]